MEKIIIAIKSYTGFWLTYLHLPLTILKIEVKVMHIWK